MFFYSHWACLRSYARSSVGVWLFVHLVIPCFHLPYDVFSFVLWTILGLSHPLALDLTHYICGKSLNPMGTHFFRYAHGGERTTSHDVVQNVVASIAKKMQVSCFAKTNPRSSNQSSCRWIDIILSVNGIHTLAKVSLSTHSNKLGIIGSFFSWGGCDIGNSCEGRTLSQSLPNGFVFPSCHRGF
jgi:hypothetical protein